VRHATVSSWRQLLPQSGTGARTIDLLKRCRLRRKRLLDSHFAATLLDNGIKALVVCDAKDFWVFRELRLINPMRSAVQPANRHARNRTPIRADRRPASPLAGRAVLVRPDLGW